MTEEVKKEETQKEGYKVFEDLTEIFSHNTPKDLWLLIDGKVYDVTNFKHPGGKQILVANAGQDCTTQFEDINHPDDAMAMMPAMCVGEYKSQYDDQPRLKPRNNSDDDFGAKVCLAVFFLALAAYLYFNLTGQASAAAEL